jgi:hypothetical protein
MDYEILINIRKFHQFKIFYLLYFTITIQLGKESIPFLKQELKFGYLKQKKVNILEKQTFWDKQLFFNMQSAR